MDLAKVVVLDFEENSEATGNRSQQTLTARAQVSAPKWETGTVAYGAILDGTSSILHLVDAIVFW